jgi:hypothetical protein
VITLTTVQDFAAVVARAIEYEGEWPVVSGIRGTTLSVGELVALGEKLRGKDPSPSAYNPAIRKTTTNPNNTRPLQDRTRQSLQLRSRDVGNLLDSPCRPPVHPARAGGFLFEARRCGDLAGY